MDINWPQKIKEITKNMEIKRIDVGNSVASVYQCISDTKIYYLKIDLKNDCLKKEYQNICWLYNKAPVSKIIEWESDEYYDYLLTSKIDGIMLCDDYYKNNPIIAITALAKGLKLLQSIDIKNCEVINNIENKLKLAKNNIQSKKIDMNDWKKETKKLFNSPDLLFDYLCDNKPETEELVFTHGDYCLPNIFGYGDEIKGFIDLGNAGVSDKWQDIAWCIWSLRYNLKTNEYDGLLLDKLQIKNDNKKFEYYILLSELL
jgi:kanamycin kinase/aminoglycoside 3'-phosphotransferase-3